MGPLGRVLPIRMAKATTWGYAIADDLFEVLYLRKTALSVSRPNSLSLDARLEYTNCAKSQCHLSLSVRPPRKSAGQVMAMAIPVVRRQVERQFPRRPERRDSAAPYPRQQGGQHTPRFLFSEQL